MFFLKLSSSGETAFGAKKALSVDVKKYSFIHWKWKADRLPEGGDIRRANCDDQALQLYVVFRHSDSPGSIIHRRLHISGIERRPKAL